MYYREAEKVIKDINESFKVLLVTGPRQVGKTTLLLSLKPDNMEYVTLDDEVLRKQAEEDPKLFLEAHPAPLFIDEVQYAPNLFSYIKIIVDKKSEKGQYWLTGSQAFHLMKNVSESLAGRVGIITLNSFTYAEIVRNKEKKLFIPPNFKETKKINVNDVFEIIFKGGMPGLYADAKMPRELFFESYINTYIPRDVRDLSQIGNEESFKKFLVSVATRNGETLNYSALAQDSGISVPTAKRWVSILVTARLIHLLEPYMATELKRITHIPKIIFMDSGLACFLAGWTSSQELQNSSVSGHFLEAYIISDIIKSYSAKGINPNISYYRNKEKEEIDLIIYQNNTLYPFEIKKTALPNKSMIKNFDKLKSGTKNIGPGGIICFYEYLTKLDENNYIIPISSVINISD